MGFRSSMQGRWGFICGAAVGTLVAFPLAAPVFDGHILEPVATTWGSALGAVAAVAGAFWVADRQAKQQHRKAAALVRAMFLPVLSALDTLAISYGPPSSTDGAADDDEPEVFTATKWSEIAQKANLCLEQHERFTDKLHRFESALNLLSIDALSYAFTLEDIVNNAMSDAVKPLQTQPSIYIPSSSTVELIDQPPTRSSRERLFKAHRKARIFMTMLRREAS